MYKNATAAQLREYIANRAEVNRLAQERINKLQRKLDLDRIHERELEQQLLAAIAREDANTFPAGTRVRFAAFADLFATVVPTDGSGITLEMDGGGIRGGYSAAELVVAE